MSLFKALFISIAAFSLTGCFSHTPMMTADNASKPLNNFWQEATSYERIKDKEINLSFHLSEKTQNTNFYWEDFQKELKSTLTEKGVMLSENGVKVRVTLEEFEVLGSSHAVVARKGVRTLTPALSAPLGLSILQNVVASVVEQKIADKKQAESLSADDGKNFAPRVVISIEKAPSYQTSFKLKSHAAVTNYLQFPKKVSVGAVAEFFTPEK